MALLEVDQLAVTFATDNGPVYAVSDVSFSVDRGQAIGIVGESGSGKSVTVKSLMGLLPSTCLLYTSPSPRDKRQSRMPSSA